MLKCLNGVVEIADAKLALTYYANNAAMLPVSFTGRTDDYETLAYFLTDINTESTAGKNTDTTSIELADAKYILTYYAQSAAMLNPEWQVIVPSLVDIPNSLWAYKAGK